MTNMRRNRQAAARHNALIAARHLGCTCNPDITNHGPGPDGIPNVSVAHDDWCPLVGHRKTYVLYEQPTRHAPPR